MFSELAASCRGTRRIQGSGDIGVRSQRGDQGDTLRIVFRPNLAAAVERALRIVAQMLGLEPTAREFRVMYGAVASHDEEIAIVSRSMHEVLKNLLSFILFLFTFPQRAEAVAPPFLTIPTTR